MKKAQKKSWGLRIIRFISIMPVLSRIVSNFIYLVEDEADQAIRKLMAIFVMLVCFGLLLTTVWVCLQAMIFMYLLSLHLSAIASLTIILIGNCLLLIIMALIMINLKKGLFFPQSKKFISTLLKS